MPPSQVAGRVPLAGFYLLHFGAVGITLPFLPAYLKSLSLSATQVGILLAVQPLMALISPHVWGALADRTGRADRVLSLVSLGAAVSFAPLLAAERFPALLIVLASYAFFAASVTTLVDSLALQRVAEEGGSYSHFRLFGSLGFVLSSVLFGLWTREPSVAAVGAPLALIAAFFFWSLSLRAPAAPARAPAPLARLGLLAGDPELRRVLLASALHWIACAPFHGTFAIHVHALGLSPAIVGLSAGIGVSAEILVMLLYPALAKWVTPRTALIAAFGLSAVRWAGMASVSSPIPIVLLSALHGMTFGAFYVAAVAFVAARVPPERRASGQAVLVSVTFGLGGLAGYVAAGTGYDWLGGHRLFAVAAGVELLAAALVLRSGRPAARPSMVG